MLLSATTKSIRILHTHTQSMFWPWVGPGSQSILGCSPKAYHSAMREKAREGGREREHGLGPEGYGRTLASSGCPGIEPGKQHALWRFLSESNGAMGSSKEKGVSVAACVCSVSII